MNTATKERVYLDCYPTSSAIAEVLLKNVPQIPELILEPCAGEDAISQVLRTQGHMVSAANIQLDTSAPADATRRDFWEYWADRLRRMPSIDCRNWATVTNPPFKVAADIVPLAFEYSPWGCAFLLPLNYLEPAKDRGQWLQDNADHLRYVIPVNPRPRFRKDTKGTANVTVAWCVWLKPWSWKELGIRCPFVFATDWR